MKHALYLAQVLMNELHSYRSLANSGSDPFHGTMAHIAHSKKTGNVGLQQEGVSVQGPSLWALSLPDEIRTGQNEAAAVSLDYIRQPVSSRQRTDKDKHGIGRHTLDLVCIRAKD